MSVDTRVCLVLVCAVLAACTGEAISPAPSAPVAALARADETLADQVRRLTAGRGIGPLHRPPPVRPALVRLGQALVFDPVLSGNRDISCMTCHHPTLATGDSRHLSIGQGARGLGTARIHPTGAFIPRNAPPLFNLHALDSFFWDGRVSMDASGEPRSPAGAMLTPAMARVFEFGALSAVGLFPVTSREEMRAFDGNELARIPDSDFAAIWSALMARLGAIPEYRRLFEEAYPGTPFATMTFAHASNAMAGFLVERLAFNDSPWDRFLAGSDDALSDAQLRGALGFMTARCSICHTGPALTDNAFHNVALAQLGPGQGDGDFRSDDFGRERVTRSRLDRYRFRTTPLRNVELTGPFGHAGQFASLLGFVDHYSESDRKLREYDVLQLETPLQPTVLRNYARVLATRDTLLNGVVFSTPIIEDVTAFMRALTDPAARNLTHLIPDRVPSGLPVER